MPVYLFTFHTYRSWMPDHRRGYTKRNKGYQKPDPNMAQEYSDRANHDDEVLLDRDLQRALIEESIRSCKFQKLQTHAFFTEPSHIHQLVSWKDRRGWLKVRMALKRSLSRRLNQISRDERNGTFLALSRGASRKHVLNRKHFDQLKDTYSRRHGGLKWDEHVGYID